MHLKDQIYDRPNSIHSNDCPVMYRFVGKLDDNFSEKVNTTLTYAIGEPIFKGLYRSLEVELSRFEGMERMEDTLSRWTQRLCSQLGSVTIEINNFSGIPPCLLFARIADSFPLKTINAQFRKLDMYLTGNGMQPLQSNNRFFIPVFKQNVAALPFENMVYRIGRIDFHETAQIRLIYLQRFVNEDWKDMRPYYLAA